MSDQTLPDLCRLEDIQVAWRRTDADRHPLQVLRQAASQFSKPLLSPFPSRQRGKWI